MSGLGPFAAIADDERRAVASALVEAHRDRIVGFGVLLAVRKRQPWNRDAFVSAALEGFWRAALVYDPARNDDLFGFATRRMAGACVDWMRTQEGLPTRIRRKREARGEFVPRQVAIPTLPPTPDGDGEDPDSVVACSRAVEGVDGLIDAEAVERVLALFENLRDREVIRLVFVVGLTLKTVGLIFGVSESRVSQFVKAAAARARPAMLRLVGAA